jgi:hypothetical protein
MRPIVGFFHSFSLIASPGFLASRCACRRQCISAKYQHKNAVDSVSRATPLQTNTDSPRSKRFGDAPNIRKIIAKERQKAHQLNQESEPRNARQHQRNTRKEA